MKKNRIVTRNAYVRNSSLEMADDESREIEFVISSEEVDNHNTVFKMSGWDLNYYRKNPIVCYQHRSNSNDPDDIIGTSTIYEHEGKLIGRITFEDAETNPKAEKVLRKVKNGTLKMASVGARVLKARFGEGDNEDKDVLYFTEARLFEWSIVTAGSNPDALKRNDEVLDEIKQDCHTEPVEVCVEKEIEKTENKSVCEAQIIINNNLYK